MGRSGKLVCTNDHIIYKLLRDPNYEIRSNGEIWTKITKTGKVSAKNTWRRAGHMRRGYCTLRYEYKSLQIHRIIYAKFGGKLEEDLVVNHKNGNGYDNDIENLELVTQSRNNYHRFNELGKPPVQGNVSLTWEAVREIRDLSESGVCYRLLSSQYGISKGHISQIINNEIWIEGKVYA